MEHLRLPGDRYRFQINHKEKETMQNKIFIAMMMMALIVSACGDSGSRRISAPGKSEVEQRKSGEDAFRRRFT